MNTFTQIFCWVLHIYLKNEIIYLPSCNGSIVCIINCNKPWRNLAPVTVPEPPAPLLEPGTAERLSDAARDVTEPPGCVAIDVSDEFAAFPWNFFFYICTKKIECLI